jgi:hypothetical protein
MHADKLANILMYVNTQDIPASDMSAGMPENMFSKIKRKPKKHIFKKKVKNKNKGAEFKATFYLVKYNILSRM